MSEKKQFRSEQARKNYIKQEKQRALAARRKELRAKKAALTEKVSAWLKDNTRTAVIIAAAAVLAVVLIWLGCKWMIGPGGSIPNFFGKLVGVQDNWLVINTAEDGRDPRYHHLADFDVPEGFRLDDFSVFDDGMQQDFYCKAEAEGGTVQDIYISGAKNMVAAEYPAILLSYGMHKEATEPREAVVAGKTGHIVTLTFDESDTDGEGMGYTSLCMYIDTGKDACISVMISSPTLPMEQLPGEAELLAEAEKILSGLTLVK